MNEDEVKMIKMIRATKTDRTFHVVTGLPRSGSTLLCNILNQNERFWATTTSVLPGLCSTLVHFWSTSPEVKGALDHNRERTEGRVHRALKAFCDAWYADVDRPVVFDKSRGWATNALLLKKVYLDSKMIVMVRDLRNIFASVEKRHAQTAMFDEASNPEEKTMFSRADKMFGPQGLIGGAIIGVEDLARRKPDGVLYVQYESLASAPGKTMAAIYDFLGEEPFEHDFENVVNTAQDPDGLYLHKYPHKGEGKVVPCNPLEWKTHVSPDIAKLIMERWPFYNDFFGYG